MKKLKMTYKATIEEKIILMGKHLDCNNCILKTACDRTFNQLSICPAITLIKSGENWKVVVELLNIKGGEK